MPDTHSSKIILLICLKERWDIYTRFTANMPLNILPCEDIRAALKICLTTPPSAIFIDMVTALKFGALTMHPLDCLRVSWPVIRCNTRPDGSMMAMSLNPPKQELLQSAIPFILQNDSPWNNPSSKRQYVRMDIRSRVILTFSNGHSYKGNCHNLSIKGAFISSYAEFPEKNLKIQFLDLTPTPILIHCIVRWQRKWEESPLIPGIGVEFETDANQIALINVLNQSHQIQEFIGRLK